MIVLPCRVLFCIAVTRIQENANGEWVPLRKGKIALQLKFAEVFYGNVEIQELGNVE